MIDTVIFDFDGTVMDTNRIIMMSWQHTYKSFRGCEGDEKEILATFGEPLEQSLINAFPDIPIEKALDSYRKFQRERFTDYIEPFPGVIELLRELKKRSYKTGLATSRLRGSTVKGLEKFGIMDCFDAIVTVEEVSRHKPEPDTLFKVLEKLGSEPAESIMLGDTLFDILCAHNAGAQAVLVGWSEALAGKKKEDFKADEVPDYIIQSPEEIFDII